MARPDFGFLAYRNAMRLAGPLGPALLAWRQAKGKEDPDRLSERLGKPSLPRLAGRLAWLHGASVGEGLALLPLVPELVARGFSVLITTGTVTSARVLAPRLPGGAVHQFVPLDVPRYQQRFLAHWRPDIVLLAESELWPNTVFEAHRRAIPVVLVNARMSERSALRWQRLSGFIGGVLGRIALCLAQTQDDAERFAVLGAPHVRVTGNLKYDAPPPGADREGLADLVARIGARRVWLAASTHDGEEAVAAAVHARLERRFPRLLTIVAPRHPERGAAIAAMARREGLSVAQRSLGAPLDASVQFYVADTIGELGLFYRLTGIVFLGKSLAGGGGQNPIEPAKLGCAIVHGPMVRNFAEAYSVLDAAQGAACVADAEELFQALSALFSDAARLRLMAREAADTIETLAGATRRTIEALEPLLAAVAERSR